MQNSPDIGKALAPTRAFSRPNAAGALDRTTIVYRFGAVVSNAPAASSTNKEQIDLKKAPPPNTTGSPGPRRPEPTVQEVLDIASLLQARQRAQLSRLSSAQRLRKWGNA